MKRNGMKIDESIENLLVNMIFKKRIFETTKKIKKIQFFMLLYLRMG
jgi:hypothetical protein